MASRPVLSPSSSAIASGYPASTSTSSAANTCSGRGSMFLPRRRAGAETAGHGRRIRPDSLFLSVQATDPAEGRGRSGKNSEGEIHPEAHVLGTQNGRAPAGNDGHKRKRVGLDPAGRREATEEIHAVLDADAVE